MYVCCVVSGLYVLTGGGGLKLTGKSGKLGYRNLLMCSEGFVYEVCMEVNESWF